MNEKRIMAECDHPFCARLVASFKDQQRLYMVLEFLPGGELFSLLQRERKLPEASATFYGCIVMLAFECVARPQPRTHTVSLCLGDDHPPPLPPPPATTTTPRTRILTPEA